MALCCRAWYTDSGAAYWDIHSNVAEQLNGGMWMTAWDPSTTHHLTVHGNYADTTNHNMIAADSKFFGNVFVNRSAGEPWPAAAAAVREGAGARASGALPQALHVCDASMRSPVRLSACAALPLKHKALEVLKTDDSSTTTSLDGAEQRPCDIYAAAKTPCAAAHAMTRALYSRYSGRLYELKRTATNATLDIHALGPGGLADVASHDKFCGTEPEADAPPPPAVYPSLASCVVSKIYDQSGNGNDLLVAGPAISNMFNDLPVNATRHAISMLGADGRRSKVYGAFFESGQGYRAQVPACLTCPPRFANLLTLCALHCRTPRRWREATSQKQSTW